MKLKNKIMFLGVLAFSLFLIGHQALASTTDGTIDPIYHYAWGENVGFIDFGSTSGNVHITDTALSGSIYGENIGWINLSTITNDAEGNLSGYAWGENIGWVDFSNTIIGTDGVFTGSAYGENIGFITFGTENNKVLTDWRPASTRNVVTTHSSGGGGSKPIIPVVTPSVINCLPGYLFDTNTGLPCTVITPVVSPTINRTLKITTPRMTGTDIKDLQTYLNNHLYDCGLVDGVYGTKTKSAVVKFQLANGLKEDGIVGPITRSYLK